MDEVATKIWAKTDRHNEQLWHPLILHMLDVAACADAILSREPKATRQRMAAVLGMDWEGARPWLLFLVACHDLGKACPGFQSKWKDMTGLPSPRIPNTGINHAFVSQIALAEWLLETGWPEELATHVAEAVGCHHGDRASPSIVDRLAGDRSAIGAESWTCVRRKLMATLLEVLDPSDMPVKPILSGPDFFLLAGLTSFADWIGSNEEWFPFGAAGDCDDLALWFSKRTSNAGKALDAIGWEHRTPLCAEQKGFDEIFGFPPRPLQQAVSDAVAALKGPAILLVEAPMGEGKTEAAFYAHLAMQRLFEHRGLYVALPTKATGNAMFERTLEFLHLQDSSRQLDLQLLHGAAALNDTFQNLRLSSIHQGKHGGEIQASEWFTHKKRALLSEYGVGTIDQALLPILPVRHNFVRLWGLANRVVIFDEIHAYDSYTGTLLIHLLRWLLALGSSVILLSATLPPTFRRKLAGVVKATHPEQDVAYPRLSVYQPGAVQQTHFAADPARGRTLQLRGIPADVACIRTALEAELTGGGMGLALVNTVQRAQDLYLLFPEGERLEREGVIVGKRIADGTEVYLLHARFPAQWRQKREDQALETFGKKEVRTGRRMLIATQVAEQSLDLDFDCIVTDLAPIDLVLQRAGRLWRHSRKARPVSKPVLYVAGLTPEEPPIFGGPLWWTAVYHEELLLRTWSLLHERQSLKLPDEIDTLVQLVYEEQVEVPEILRERLDQALEVRNGETIAQKGQANQAIIGLPDDASWDQPERFVLFDEDEPGLHRTLMAQTRLGQDSVIVVPVWPEDAFEPDTIPDLIQSKKLFMRAISVSRKGVVRKFQSSGVPEGWRQSPLLRNCHPLLLDTQGCWTVDAKVCLDHDLGLLYQTTEGA